MAPGVATDVANPTQSRRERTRRRSGPLAVGITITSVAIDTTG
jgi:hypothetical protein